MVIRVLPASKGGIYSNLGSSNFLVNYLEHEAREEKQTDKAIFFDQRSAGIDAGTVQERIDANVLGLQKGKPGFHSLVISPSQEELKHIDNDPEKLTAYTRQVMENYAANFTDKRQRSLKSDDLVWFATIHRSRHYTGLDDAVQTGKAQSRQPKEGEQTHIHVVVSARDRSMSRSLHPDAGSRRFDYRTWLNKNSQDFTRSFGYKEAITQAQHEQRLVRQIDRLNRAGLSLDREPVFAIGRQHDYSPTFWKGMGQVERGVKQGNIFTANQAFDRLKATLEPNEQPKRSATNKSAIVVAPVSSERSSTRKTGTSQSAQTINALVVRPERVGEGKDRPVASGIANVASKGASRLEPQQSRPAKPARTDLSPLLTALRLESVPETGEHVRTQSDEYRRKIRRRR